MEQQDILRFWRDVEIFDLPDFNKEAYLIQQGDNLPWLNEYKAPKKNYKWRYTLVFGKIDKGVIVDHLNDLLKADSKSDWEESVTGTSCFSALILDEKGHPQEDSYVVASYTFGIRALETNKNLSIVSNDIAQSKNNFLDRYNFRLFDMDGESKFQGERVLWEHLNKETDYLKGINKWWEQAINIYLLVESVPKDSKPNTSFLNSFYLDDLNYLATAKEKELGVAIRSYLTLTPPTEKRKDLIQNKEFLLQSFDPQSMTSGRWPSKVEYGLYSAQAGAVNTIFSNLRVNEGLQGVNGPPGTGKTTLLLDVIAEIIVDRAKVISDLGCDKLFENGYQKIEKESGYDRYTYSLRSSLKNDFGIVVASNNNAAVENISKELPLKKKIDLDTFPDADYFSACSQRLIDEESWGILAAALGNMKNRAAFKKAFWKSEKDSTSQNGFHDLLYNIYKDEDNSSTYHNYFREQDKLFNNLLQEFESFKKLASTFHHQLPEYIKNTQREDELIKELSEMDHILSKLAIERTDLIDEEHITEQNAARNQSLLSLQLERKPAFFFFQKLFSTSAYKQWNAESENLINKSKHIDSLLDNIRKKLTENKNEVRRIEDEQKKVRNTLEKLHVFFLDYKKLQNTLCEAYDIDIKNLLDINFSQKDLEEIHLLNPYHSPKTAKLRSDIFIAALQLHQYAILGNAKKIRNNLTAFFEMLSGWPNVSKDIAQNLWDTFYLCVPVVSTTLASASRLLPDFDKNQIGWLLIDEAGQATPQSAAGLIHRSKRCVIVGDPLQVEPVVSMPEKLVAKLRKEQHVEIGWSPHKVSVQQLADRVSLSGTYMQVGESEEKVWTGFPLRTHRRCDNPMFSIANEIAYGNQMVKAVAKDSDGGFIGPSNWFHVDCNSTPHNKHVILEEVELLKLKIKELQQAGYSGDIYIISPFKSVADYCSNEFRMQKKISCGTIHKFQGKEADIVFLVLGSNPTSSGARNWASQKPNMLNVALTRAKNRFYVIGNKTLWGSCNYFNIMANTLD